MAAHVVTLVHRQGIDIMTLLFEGWGEVLELARKILMYK
jgi:hypothetical protein